MKKNTTSSSLRRGISTRLNNKKNVDEEKNISSSSRTSNINLTSTNQYKTSKKKDENRSQKNKYDMISYAIKSPTNGTRSSKSSDLEVKATRAKTQQKIAKTPNFPTSNLKSNDTYTNKYKQNNCVNSTGSFKNNKDIRPNTQRSFRSLSKTQQYGISFGKSSFKEEKKVPASSRNTNKKSNIEKKDQNNSSFNKQKSRNGLNGLNKIDNTKMKKVETMQNKERNDQDNTQKIKNEIVIESQGDAIRLENEDIKSNTDSNNKFDKDNNIQLEKDDNRKFKKDNNTKLTKDNNTKFDEEDNIQIENTNNSLSIGYSPEFNPIFVNQRPPLTEVPPAASPIDFKLFQQMMLQIQKSILELQKKFDDKICNIQKKIANIEFLVSELQK